MVSAIKNVLTVLAVAIYGIQLIYPSKLGVRSSTRVSKKVLVYQKIGFKTPSF